MVLFGYEDDSKAYWVFDPVGRKLHVTRDVVFEEQVPWSWDTEATMDAAGEWAARTKEQVQGDSSRGRGPGHGGRGGGRGRG